MALETYQAKRDFSATPEPKGRKGRARGDSFVLQRHAARRLHYDLRLEIGGVLKSWAVTRGPSLVAGEKRLAVEVEDHPLDYGRFEGVIPKGGYGAGEVIVWDRGRWRPEGDAARGLARGRLEFTLEGEKLRGRWRLVRMAGKPGEKRVNWLLIKGGDDFARDASAPDILEERPESVLTGARPPRTAPRGKPARAAPFPGFVAPALATLRAEPPSGEGWIHEVKFDGYRLQAALRNGEVRLLTRTGLDWTERFGVEVIEALAGLGVESAILDGEIVVETPRGTSDFAALQADMAEGRADRFRYYLFDLLYLDGADLRDRPLEDRQARLAGVLAQPRGPLRLSEPFAAAGDVILRHACQLSLEGVVSKKRGAPYRSGRGKDWIKSKCAERQEFVIGGFAPSTARDGAIGSLALGHWEAGRLIHAGRVGTGFDRRAAEDLFRRLEPLARKDSPFADPLDARARRDLVFVRPELVAEVEFRGRGAQGLLRHASFHGLREDKPAAEVSLEAPARAARPGRLTSPDRVYWPESGTTKADLADWYAAAWPRMAPHLIQRPLALLRCPEGRAKACFFQKHAWKGQSRDILTLDDPGGAPGETLLAVGDLAGLIGLVQGGALEIHGWQARLDGLETPDRIVIDLDPGEGVGWAEVVSAAGEVRARLEAAGLAGFVKTTGGKGLHVVAPLVPKAGWDAVKGFARDVATEMTRDAPKRFVATVSKARRKGRILVDYLRNARGATAVIPYSSRARAGATVSVPLAWEELGPEVAPGRFTLRNARQRLEEPDPWAAFDAARSPLGAAGRKRR